MKNFFKSITALIAVLILSMTAVFAASPPESQSRAFSLQRAFFAGSPVSLNAKKIVPFTEKSEGLALTAFQNHVQRTDAGNLIERISLGLAKENPFYKHRNFSFQAITGREPFYLLKATDRKAEGLIYDLPPNLRFTHCEIGDPDNFPRSDFKFRLDRSRYV